MYSRRGGGSEGVLSSSECALVAVAAGVAVSVLVEMVVPVTRWVYWWF